MRIFYLIIIVLLLVSDAHATEVFTDKTLNEIYIVEIAGGAAYIQSNDGITEEVVSGDIISIEGGEIIEILSTHIEIEIDGTRTILPVISTSNENPGIQ